MKGVDDGLPLQPFPIDRPARSVDPRRDRDARAEDLNDYPTSARADYVFACMKANGETQELLQKCSCSIDVIASIIPYDRYVTTETILSMSQVTGPVGSEFRSTEQAKLALQEFRRRAGGSGNSLLLIRDRRTSRSRQRYSIDFSIRPFVPEYVLAGIDGLDAKLRRRHWACS